MGKSSDAKQRVTEYSMSMHIGLAAEVDELLEIQIGEKTAWSGSVTAESAFLVNSPTLFGGVKKEGGVSGYCYFMPGGPLQTVPTTLASRLGGLTRENCPGFRGLASLWFVGTFLSDTGWLPTPGGTSGGGGGGGGGSEDDWLPPGGSCPAPWCLITLANAARSGPGIDVRADDLRPGMWVWTQHETTLAWGAFEVEAVQVAPANARWLLRTDDGRETCATPNHRLHSTRGWTRIDALIAGDILSSNLPAQFVQAQFHSVGDVVKITVRDAHTYLMDGLLAHNVKPDNPPLPEEF